MGYLQSPAPAHRSGRSLASSSLGGILALAAILATASPAPAQLPQTRLYSLFPPGGKAGATTEVRLTSGADLEEIDTLLFNHPGIHAEQKTQQSDGETQPVTNTFLVTVKPDVPAGVYEVRAGGRFGLSNPRSFVVGTRDETTESEGNNSPDQADDIQPETTLNGQISGNTDVDYFKFTGTKDQRILVRCQAARIDSRLEPSLEIYDAAGAQIAYTHHDLRDDALLDVTLPADGDYFVKLYDFTYGGGAEYFYRLLLTTGPHIDFIMPPAGLPGTTGTYTLYGRNLPGGESADVSLHGRPLQRLDVKITLPEDPATLKTTHYLKPSAAAVDGISYVLQTEQGHSNPVLIQFAEAPVTLEDEPNDTPEHAQAISLPGELAGQFQDKGDVDYISFEAKAKETYYVEVFAERHGTTADPYLVLERVINNDDGEQRTKRITAQDDNNSNLLGNVFETRTDDPVYRFQVPADGTYRISLRDRYFEARGNPRLIYRLAIRKPQPDFRLAVLPLQPAQGNNRSNATWAVGLRQGDNVAADVMAFRRDGFNETIDVWAENLPEGVHCKGASIGADQNTAKLIFTADENAQPWSGLIEVHGKVRIEDPNKVKAVQQAREAVRAAKAKLAETQTRAKTAAEALTALQGADEQLALVQEMAQKDLKDDHLLKVLSETRKNVDAVSKELQNVKQAKEAAAQKLDEAQAALQTAQAERQAAVREIVREARSATVVWSGDNNRPEVSRVAKSLGLSVLPETAPYHLTTDVFKVSVNRGRQILVPIQIDKRKGFDSDVNLQWLGLPRNSNIDVQNQPVKKGNNHEVLRLFAKNNARLGTYTLYLKSQAQVKYRRNPERVERAKTAQAEAAEALKQAQQAAQKAKQGLEDATKQANADAEALKKATAAKTEADKQLNAAQQTVNRAAEEQMKAAQLAETAAKAAEAAGEAAEKLVAVKEAGPQNQQQLDKAVENAQQAAADAAKIAKQAKDAQTAAEKKLDAAQNAAQKAQDELAAAVKAVENAQKEAQRSAQAKQQAEQAVQKAEAQVKTAQQDKQQADKRLQQAEKAAQPKNVNLFPPSTPVVVEVKPAPANVSASVPQGGNLKKGETLEIKVTAKRKNGFDGPLTVHLPLPPGVDGLAAEPVTIPADKNEGVLTVRATDEATEGQLANMVVRATTQFNGEEAAVDAPIKLKVSK